MRDRDECKNEFKKTHLSLIFMCIPFSHCPMPFQWFHLLKRHANGIWQGCDLATFISDARIDHNLAGTKFEVSCRRRFACPSVADTQRKAQRLTL